MSKTLKKIIIMLLVLTMLFSVSAVTIGAVSSEVASSASNSTEGGGDAGGGSEQENQQSDSLTTGWCDVSYDASTNEITVVLTPDKSAILGINKSQVSELLAIVGEAVKNVALDDILDEFGGIEIIQGGLNAENVWEKALDAYLNNHYSDVVTDSNGNGSLSDERKMEFIKDALDSNGGTARVEDFADFVCSLVRAAVLVKPEIRDSLPDANGIDEYVENVLNTLLHNTIDGYIDTAVRDYIKYIKGEGAETDLTETIETYMHSLVEETVNEYVANIGNASYEGDQLYKYLSDYIDSHIKTEAENAIRAYIEAKIRGTAVDSTSFVYATIEEYADDYIEACVKTYISNKLAGREPVAGSADALFKPYIEQFTKDYINDLAEKYIAEKEGGAAAPTDELNLMIQGEIDKFISTFVEDRFTEYKAYKFNPVGEKPDFYTLIEEKVRAEVIAHIVADSDGAVDEAAAAQKYDNGEIAASEYLTYINENDVKSYAKSNLSASDYQKAFDSFDEAEMDNVITTVFANLDDAKLQLILSGNKVIASIAPPAEDPDRDTKIQNYINTIVGGIGFDDAVDDAIQNLDSQKRADLVEEMYEKLTDDEINDMISESIVDFTDDDIDSLVTELVAIANDKL